MAKKTKFSIPHKDLVTIPHGMSVPQFAKWFGVSQSTMEAWIIDGQGPKIAIVRNGHRPTRRITPPAARAWLMDRYE